MYRVVLLSLLLTVVVLPTWTLEALGEVEVSRVILLEIAPPFDRIDLGQYLCFRKAYEKARLNNAVLVYVVDSPGGCLKDATLLADIILHGDAVSVAVVNGKALSAATIIAIPADYLIAVKGSIMGYVVPGYRHPITLEKVPVEDMNKALAAGLLKTSALLRDRNASAVERFVYDALVVNSSTALSLGVINAEIESIDELPRYLSGLVIEKNGIRYRLSVDTIERYTCTVESRAVTFFTTISHLFGWQILTLSTIAMVVSVVRKNIGGLFMSVTLMVLMLIESPMVLTAIVMIAAIAAVICLVKWGASIKERAMRAVASSAVPLTCSLLLLPLDVPAGLPTSVESIVYWSTILIVVAIALHGALNKLVELVKKLSKRLAKKSYRRDCGEFRPVLRVVY